ncbi:MAG: hypothetical protein ACRDAT_07070 [Cetobacterium sp.]
MNYVQVLEDIMIRQLEELNDSDRENLLNLILSDYYQFDTVTLAYTDGNEEVSAALAMPTSTLLVDLLERSLFYFIRECVEVHKTHCDTRHIDLITHGVRTAIDAIKVFATAEDIENDRYTDISNLNIVNVMACIFTELMFSNDYIVAGPVDDVPPEGK